jgi:hypothetical protein
MRRPIHAVGQTSTVRASFLCPNEAVAHALRRVTRKTGRYGAGKVIMGEQVDDDQDARRNGQPWPRNGRQDDVDCICESLSRALKKMKIRDIRKQSVPRMKSTVAAATKNGPAAPVTQSPQRSIRLKQAKTKRGRAPGMTRNGLYCVL